MASHPAIKLNLNLYQSGEYHSTYLTTHLPYATHIPVEACSVTDPNRKLVDRSGSQNDLGFWLTCPAGLVLVDRGIDVQLGPS